MADHDHDYDDRNGPHPEWEYYEGPDHVDADVVDAIAVAHEPQAPAFDATLPIGQHLYEDLSGTAGCLHGDTEVIALRGNRNGGRPVSLAWLYAKFNGHAAAHKWDRTFPTYLHSLSADDVMFYNQIVAVYQSGIKPLVCVALDDDTSLTLTADHPVMTPNGFVPAGDLAQAGRVTCRGTMRAQSSGGRDLRTRPKRVLINVKYHPFGAVKQIRYAAVGGPADSVTTYEYTRVPRARLVVEAARNHIPYDEFVHILKHAPTIAETFTYLSPREEVHHRDENTLHDELHNLQVLTKAEHARQHDQRQNFRFDSTVERRVRWVRTAGSDMTYDVQMTAPANNFCANGIVVHNTGKTTLARELIRRSPRGSIILAATTGIAAVNLGEGTTINAALKYFDTASLRDNYTHGTLTAQIRKHKRAGVRRILIDEKSMMNGEQLTYIARACDEANKIADAADAAAEDEFGYEHGAKSHEGDPIGITLIGDFGQLPPVPDEDPRTGKKVPIQFAFDSPEWGRFAAHRTVLEKIWRQDNREFVEALHAIRRADVTKALSYFTAARFADATDDRFEGTTILAKNDAVDRYNQLRLDQLKTRTMEYASTRRGKPRGDWKQIPPTLRVKEGALVMLLANRRVYEDEEDGTGKLIYANGDLGTVLESDADGWWVRLHRTGQPTRVYPIRRENTVPLEPGRRKELVAEFGLERIGEHVTEDGKGKSEIVGVIDYMPMRLAYGCTVHKTQGLTLDQVQVNIRDPFFAHPGMLFVALSRARTIDGLRIVGNQRGFAERCKMDPRVTPWL